MGLCVGSGVRGGAAARGSKVHECVGGLRAGPHHHYRRRRGAEADSSGAPGSGGSNTDPAAAWPCSPRPQAPRPRAGVRRQPHRRPVLLAAAGLGPEPAARAGASTLRTEASPPSPSARRLSGHPRSPLRREKAHQPRGLGGRRRQWGRCPHAPRRSTLLPVFPRHHWKPYASPPELSRGPYLLPNLGPKPPYLGTPLFPKTPSANPPVT